MSDCVYTLCMIVKNYLSIILLFFPLLIFADDTNSKEFIFVSTDSVGSVLFADNCLSCHSLSYFNTSNPDEESVNELTERIDTKIYEQGSPMTGLDSFKYSEIKKIAWFLIYGRHIEGWVDQEYHGEFVEEQSGDSCIKCHDNNRIRKVEISSCSDCH
jgi:hypothetical protein